MSSKLRKRIKSLNGLFFHEHENKKASNGPVDHFFLRPRNWKGAAERMDHFFMSLEIRKRGTVWGLHRQVTADKVLGRFDS